MKESLTTVKPKSQVDMAIRLLQEKVSREYNITVEELSKKTIIIKNGELTVKEK